MTCRIIYTLMRGVLGIESIIVGQKTIRRGYGHQSVPLFAFLNKPDAQSLFLSSIKGKNRKLKIVFLTDGCQKVSSRWQDWLAGFSYKIPEPLNQTLQSILINHHFTVVQIGIRHPYFFWRIYPNRISIQHYFLGAIVFLLCVINGWYWYFNMQIKSEISYLKSMQNQHLKKKTAGNTADQSYFILFKLLEASPLVVQAIDLTGNYCRISGFVRNDQSDLLQKWVSQLRSLFHTSVSQEIQSIDEQTLFCKIEARRS